MLKAFELDQPLCDVASGPDGSFAAVGDKGDCFLLDPRQEDVHVFGLPKRAHGPARLAWSHRQSVFASAWQGDDGGLALYNTHPAGARLPGQMLRSPGFGSPVADLCWSPAHPDLLCCAKEDGVVEVWHFPVHAATPCFRWEPARGESCTALAASAQIRPGLHTVFLATMAGASASQTDSSRGTMWITTLPEPNAGTVPSLRA